MTFQLSREQAQAAVTAAAAERDTIQSNLLDLDGSLGKRLLAGATLTGQSRDAWDQASASLAGLWDTFSAYSAVIDRAGEIVNAPGKITAPRLVEASNLLTGPSVQLARAVAPLAQRELTSGGQAMLSLQSTIREMRQAFSQVAAVLTAAETVWNQISDGIGQVTADIGAAKGQLPGLPPAELGDALAQAETNLAQLRELLNSDPLALWVGGRVDNSRLDRLKQQAATAIAQVSEIARTRGEADQRLAEVRAAVEGAKQAHSDATVARERAASRIFAAEKDLLPDVAGFSIRLEDLTALRSAGRWTRLASELDLIGKQVATATRQCREAEQAAAGLIEQRNELRGMLDAYRAKAGGTGGAEDAELDQRYQEAKNLLWTAPCDLAAASAAVTSYQQAVLHLRRSGERQ
jgi:chromosome segregation ATPase